MLDGIASVDLFERQSISDQVYHHVKALILSGALKSGEKIPEIKVAEHFHVSRTPVREAIRKLAEYGLVVIKPRSFAYVVTISNKEANDIALVRLSLECLSVRSFAQSATPEALATLRYLADKCKEANVNRDLAATHEYDSQLHLMIAEQSGNTELIRILRTLDAKLQLIRMKQHVPPETLTLYLDQHRTLIQLIEKKDFDTIDSLLKMHIIHDIN